MKKGKRLWIGGTALVVVLIAGYLFMNQSLGNNVEIESVLPTQGQASPSASPAAGDVAEAASTAQPQPSAAAAGIGAEQLNGEWTVAEGSKVYWSVTTSKETVNFVDDAVTGSWSVNVEDAASMKGIGEVDLNALDSGNGQRDGHVKGDDYLAVAAHPKATFTAASFTDLPEEWTEGTAVPLEMAGTLTVKGIEKDVVFQSQTAYSGGKLMLSGTTKVLFSDFGMTNPHNVVLDTENEFEVRLELILEK